MPPKPSITYWNRIEPTPRGDSLMRGLEAAVRDPAWFIGRQWQMGEFRGEDAGSPSLVSFQASASRFTGWRAAGGEDQPFSLEAPLEVLAEREDVTPNWLLSLELGQMLEQLLGAAGASQATIDRFVAAYPVPRIADLSDDDRRDGALARLLRVCGGRGIDGIGALRAAEKATPAVPSELAIAAGQEQELVAGVLAAFIAWVAATYGSIGVSDAPAWQPQRLDYGIEARAQTPDSRNVTLRAEPSAHGDFQWYSFDEIGSEASAGVEPETIALSMLPTNVNFSGMPNSRWWQFEDSRFNWTSVDVDRRELGKTMLLDFMLVQGNDWFLVPFGQPVGSLLRVDQLLVRDVFGDYSLVRRADAGEASASARWTMFSTLAEGEPGEPVADYFILPPSALRTTIDGLDLEEVRFLRDEQSNLVWGVEATTENGAGGPLTGHERSLDYVDEAPLPPTTAPLRYRLQTAVPVHWIPFPPVQVDASRRAVALERAAMERYVDGALVAIHPRGRVLNPSAVAAGERYRINEEEVTRSGTRVLRAAHRTRWLDGGTHVWVARRRRAGMGEGASGLRYDIVEEAE